MSTFDPELKESSNFININFTNNINPQVYYNDSNMLVIDNIFSDEEIEQLIEIMDNNIKINNNKNRGSMNINCDDLSKIIKQRCNNNMPDNIYKYCYLLDTNNHNNNQMYWVNPNINPSWRLVKCNPNSYLTKHYDGVYVKSVDLKSIYSVLIYLNDTDGDTTFENINITPKKGRLVIFDQELLHEGLVNTKLKYFIRSEIMYERLRKVETDADKNAIEIYKLAALSNDNANELSLALSLDLEKKAFEISPLLEHLILNL